MRELIRKKIKKHAVIFSACALCSAILILQNVWVEQYLSQHQININKWAGLQQNLTMIGLDANEIDAIMQMENFKQKYPQFSEATYKDAVGFFLSENPNFPGKDDLYARIASAQFKIGQVKEKLKKQSLTSEASSLLKKIGYGVFFIYPLYIAIRIGWLARKRTKS